VGVYEGTTGSGVPYAVVNLQGRVFMASIDDPFRAADRLLEQITAKVIFVDFHAEATSEKIALGWYLDGRVTALIGTHTHIPTADARVLPGGTAYQTDVGMTGPYDSVIGVQKEQIVQRFLNGLPARFEAAINDVRLCAVLVECDPTTGRALGIERILVDEDGHCELSQGWQRKNGN
jgi:metallophosphoesterase (TIGR00282 family)